MVINRIEEYKGVFEQPWYQYDWRAKGYFVSEYRKFYYIRTVYIDGIGLIIGSLNKGCVDTVLELSTGSMAATKDLMKIHSLNIDSDDDLLKYLEIKVKQNSLGSLSEIVEFHKKELNLTTIELWQINLLIS